MPSTGIDTARQPKSKQLQGAVCKDYFAVYRDRMPTLPNPPEWRDPDRDVVVTPPMLRGLVHPIRVRLLRLLREHGPATATGLAARIGQSSGVTSYHLRVLAENGFVVDDPERGNGRERWWRSTHRSSDFTFRVPGEQGDEHDTELAEQFIRMVAEHNFERVTTFIDTLAARREELPMLPWQMSDWSLRMTRDEVRAFTEKVNALAAAYRNDADEPESEARPGTERVVFQFQILPDEQP